jgi:hypothetical protein
VFNYVIKTNDVEEIRFVRRIRQVTVEDIMAASSDGGGKRRHLHTTCLPANRLRRVQKSPETAPHVQQDTIAFIR